MSDFTNKIEAFVKGELTAEETAAFRQEITRDKELALQVQVHQLEWEAAHLLREKDLRNKFKHWEKEERAPKAETRITNATKQKPKAERRFSYRQLAIAASILFIIGIGSLFLKSQQYTNEALFTEAYLEPTYTNRLRSRGPTSNNLNNSIQSLFDKKDYTELINQLKTIPDNDPDYVQAQLLMGHAFFQKGKTEENNDDFLTAIPYYQNVLAQQANYEIKSEAEWYILLSQLKNNQVDKAFLNKLDSISKDVDHDYKQNAKTLLDNTESNWYKWNALF